MGTNHKQYSISSRYILQKLEAKVFKVWNNIESYDYNNYDDNKDFDGYEEYEGFDDFDDIINQEGGIQIYMFEPFS